MSNASREGNGGDQPIDFRSFHFQLSDRLLLTNVVRNDGEELVRLDFVLNTEWETIQAIVANSIPASAHVESRLHDMRDDLNVALTLAIAAQAAFGGGPVEVLS